MTDEQHELLEQYAAGADLMRGVLGLVPREQWDSPTGPGEWTARQVFVHFADSELVGAGRIRQLLAEEGPTLYFYNQEGWAQNLDYAGATPEEAIALAVVVRRSTATLLRRVVGEATWARTATHPVRGVMDLATLLRLYIGHVEGHIAQLEGIAAKLARQA
jgi:hypothetical protein